MKAVLDRPVLASPAQNLEQPYGILFLLFFASGFCGLVYQTVWMRLALASFGVITPVVSVVLSVFMLGLGLGSWAGGKFIGQLKANKASAITFYGISELIIAAGAFAVPALYGSGEQLVLHLGQSNSAQYLFASAIMIAASIFVFSTAMGTTFPFVMSFLDEFGGTNKRAFSFLYVANVAGAVLGTLSTVFILIELFGFRHTLLIAAATNLLIGLFAIGWGATRPKPGAFIKLEASDDTGPLKINSSALVYIILFTTGFTSMAMEVVWTREFTAVLGNVVYSFASLLAAYLLASCFGSLMYRADAAHGATRPVGTLIALLAIGALLPVVLDQQVPHLLKPLIVAGPLFAVLGYLALALKQTVKPIVIFLTLSVVAGLSCAVLALPELAHQLKPLMVVIPFCAVLGYLTPLLIDELSQGSAKIAGKAYAVNIIGCIIGPLLAGYILLPMLSIRLALVVLAVPILVVALKMTNTLPRVARIGLLPISVLVFIAALFCHSWEEGSAGKIAVKRDYVATTAASGEGMNKGLLVNGVAMTILTPITQFMAHMPMAFHSGHPTKALVICFGMGTTFRSLMSWGIDVTAVELVPGVKELFSYFHKDAAEILRKPNGRIIVDDGRRFLKRTNAKFDVIVMDPPPPVPAAGSSLLYSADFYRELRGHLNPGGIIQQWYPNTDGVVLGAVARSIVDTFPYVRAYKSVDGWGWHFLMSEQPIPDLSAESLLQKMPPTAKADLAEWYPAADTAAELQKKWNVVLGNQADPHKLCGKYKITDDAPFNEYFWLRKQLGSKD
jgi:spermidine synthase